MYPQVYNWTLDWVILNTTNVILTPKYAYAEDIVRSASAEQFIPLHTFKLKYMNAVPHLFIAKLNLFYTEG